MKGILATALLTLPLVAQVPAGCLASMPDYGAPDIPLSNGYAVDGTFTYLGIVGGDCSTEPRLPCRFYFEVKVEVTMQAAPGAGDFQVCVGTSGGTGCVPIPLTDVSGPNPPPYKYLYWESFPGYEVPCGTWINLSLQHNPGMGFFDLAWVKMACTAC